MCAWQFCPLCGATLEPGAASCSSCGGALPTDPTTAGVPTGVNVSAEDLAKLEEDLREALSPSYVVVKRLGTGGMGSVFLARQPALKRLVAVKVLAPALAVDPGARARFGREAQAVARLAHPNIVAIHSVGQLEDETPYFVMQYVSGRSMSERIEEEGALPSEEARHILGEVASALAAAHAQGIIHRDIKPANILYDDESGRVLVSDFGIAAVRPRGEEKGVTRLTQTGMAIGTPQYMSPEQLLAEDVTEKTDVYAMGLFAYEMLAGSGPFAATSPQELIAAHLRDTPKALSEVAERVDPELESAVHSCLNKEPEERPTAQEIAQRFNPGADVLLEWPAPGLDRMHGALRPVTKLFAIGSVLSGIGLVALFAFGPDLSSAISSALTFIILILGAAGILALATATVKMVRLSGAAARAVRAGFGWWSIGETLADRRGDTGALIAGMREYASVAPTARDRLRKRRLLREAILFAAAVLPVLLVIVAVRLSVALLGPSMLPLALFGPSLFCLILVRVFDRRETRAVGAARQRLKRRRGEREGDSRLVASWTESFESVRRGQTMGPGPTARPAAGRFGSWALGLTMTFTVLVFIPIGTVGVLGPALWTLMGGMRVSSTEDKARVADAVREYAAEIDSSITPIEAGRAYYSIVSVGRRARRGEGIPQHPVPKAFPDQYYREMSDELFRRVIIGADGQPMEPGGRLASNAPNHFTIIRYAAGGLTPEETRYLEHLAALPQWEAWATVARAPAVDYIAARYVLPFPDSVLSWNLPFPTGMQTPAYASVNRAALLMAQGRVTDAEEVLRETIGFGFKMMDQTTLIEALIGVAVVSIGREALAQFYTSTDRPDEAATLRSRVETTLAFVEDARATRSDLMNVSDVRSVRAVALATLDRGSRVRSLRFGLIDMLAFAPCTNVRELLLGPDEDLTVAIDRARRELAYFESERHLIDMMLDTPRRGSQLVNSGPAPLRVVRGLGKLSSVVLGNERIDGCVAWITGVG